MLLSDSVFSTVIASTPLVSIDLVVRNELGEALLGQRVNSPAKGYWFVTGGRIRKGELLRDALHRVAQDELGISARNCRLIGVFDHIYDDNFFAIPNISTHYVAIGYELQISSATSIRLDAQHAKFKWWPINELLASEEVHQNTKLYFKDPDGGVD